MGAGRKTTTVTAQEKYHDSWKVNASAAARNLSKLELGAIIFGCKHSTIKECLEKEIFGLPAGHYPYVKKATPGLTLFLFNYSDRKLHGIYEAVSSGGMNISPNAWITSGEGAETTPYPAQVRIRTRCRCRPLFEEEIKPIIANNYYEDKHFWFELDKEQTKGLMTLFQSSPWPENMRSPSNADWMKNKFNGPSKSTAIKTAGKELKDVDSKEHCGMARARRKENEHSNASVVSNVSAYPPGKKWSELFKASSSSSVENNAEVLECQEALNPSTECIEVNSNAWSGLPPEACNGAVNDESDSDVVECWEDSDLVDDYVKEIFENSVQNQNEYSGNPDLNIPSAENTTFLDGWGDLKPSESDFGQTEERREDFIDSYANNESDITSTPVLDCERHGNQPSAENTTFVDGWGDLIPSKSDIGKIEERREDFIYSKANNESDIISAPVGDCERDGNQLNFIETRVQRENGSLSEGVLMDVESSNFLYAITKFMQEIEELKAVQFNQCLRTQTLEHELVHSKQEIDELKKRCQKLEGL